MPSVSERRILFAVVIVLGVAVASTATVAGAEADNTAVGTADTPTVSDVQNSTDSENVTLIWNQTVSLNGSGFLSSVTGTADGGYAVAGASGEDGVLTKFDSSGHRQWSETYGKSGTDVVGDLTTTADSGYVMVGRNGTDSGDGAAWILKTGPDGETQWHRNIGTSGFFLTVERTGNRSIVAGQGWNRTAIGDRVLSIDSTGAVLWNRSYSNPDSYGSQQYDSIQAVDETAEGGYVLAGPNRTASGYEGRVLQTNADGSVEWQWTAPWATTPNAIQPAGDSGYVVAGRNGWVAKISTGGSLQWNVSYDRAVTVYDLQRTSTGDFLVVGADTTSGTGFVSRVSGDGRSNWFVTMEHASILTDIQRDDRSGYTLVGTAPESGDGVLLTIEVSDGSPTRPTVAGADGPATNLDDDTQLEDVDGNGRGDIFDVLTYYEQRNSEVVQANPDLFNFDGRGQPGTIFDAIALYQELNG